MLLSSESETELPVYQKKKTNILTYKLSTRKGRSTHIFQKKNNYLDSKSLDQEGVKSLSELPGKDCVCSWKLNNFTKGGLVSKREGWMVIETSRLWNLLLKVQERSSRTGRNSIIQLIPAYCFYKFSSFMNFKKCKQAVSVWTDGILLSVLISSPGFPNGLSCTLKVDCISIF